MTVSITTKNGEKQIYKNVETFKTERQRGNGDWIILTGEKLNCTNYYTDPFPGCNYNDLSDVIEKQGEFYIGYEPGKDEIAIW